MESKSRLSFSGIKGLFWVCLRRPVFSVQTLVCCILLAVALLITTIWNYRGDGSAELFLRRVITPIYTIILLPLFSMCFSADAIAGDREDQTLVYLLSSPIPRPIIYLTKLAAAILQTSFWTMGAFTIITMLAGAEGRRVFVLLWPVYLLASIAYSCLFLVLSVLLKRATIAAFCYAVFLEILVGTMPGTIKRATVSYYVKCAIFDVGSDISSGPRNPAIFLPVSGNTAILVLALGSVGLTLVGMLLFYRKQFT